MRLAAMGIVSALALAGCGQGGGGGPAAVFPNLGQAAFRAEVNVIAHDGQTVPLVMIRDGANHRMEFDSPQGRLAIISNGATGESFVLTTAGGRTTAIRGGLPGGGVADPSEAWSGDMAARATRTGACSGAGETGSTWTTTESGDSVCVTNDGVILSATQDGRTVWETTRVQRGPQSADLFQLPPGVQAVDFGSIIGGAMGAAQGQAPTAPGGLCQTLRQAGAPPDALAQAGC